MSKQPMTEAEAIAYVDRLRAQLAAANARAEAAEAKLATILKLAELRWDINVAGNHDPEYLLKKIEAIAKGETP